MNDDSDTAGFSEPIDVPNETPPSAAEPRRSRGLGRRAVVVTVLAVGVAAGGGAIAAAAGGHGGGTPSGAGGPAGGYGMAGPEGGGMPGAPGGRPGPGGPLTRSIHGTFVVPSTSNGTTTYVTDVQQTGTVTAVSSTSISLRSADGYTATYVIGSSTKKDSSVANGSTATVVATGDPATALVIHGPRAQGPGGMGERPGPGGMPPSGAPSTAT